MSSSVSDSYNDWQRKVKLLCASAWRDANLNQTKVDLWLENFNGAYRSSKEEQLHAFHLLQQFIYFGREELMQCLAVLFRDHYVYPFVQTQKAAGVPWQNIDELLGRSIIEETRFVAVGAAAESGHSFLYEFRKANNLPMEAFAIDEDVVVVNSPPEVTTSPTTLKHLIYVDDFCATGQQVSDRVAEIVHALRKCGRAVRVSYYLLFATEQGIANLKASALFDDVAAAIVLDSDYRAFGPSSHFYKQAVEGVSMETGRMVMHGYGTSLFPAPLGYGDCQLMIGFFHNTPDNTLPVFWANGQTLPWHAIFPRAHKH